MAYSSLRIVGSFDIVPQAAENVVSSNTQQHSQPPTPSAMPQQAPSSSANAERLYENSIHKSRLLEYTQRARIQFPVYHTVNNGTQHLPNFESTVSVNGVRYSSEMPCAVSKHAEQDAARVACEALFRTKINEIKESEDSEDCNNPALLFLSKYTMFCKSILNEFATKLNVARPAYDTVQQPALRPVYVSSLVFNGTTYTGDIARKIKVAEQLAARAAITSLLGDSRAGELYEMIMAKANMIAKPNARIPQRDAMTALTMAPAYLHNINGEVGSHVAPSHNELRMPPSVPSLVSTGLQFMPQVQQPCLGQSTGDDSSWKNQQLHMLQHAPSSMPMLRYSVPAWQPDCGHGSSSKKQRRN